MDTDRRGRAPRPILRWTIEGLAALVGAAFGFDFGAQVGGIALGLLAAGCGAAFCVMMVGGVAERFVRSPGQDRGAR
ncbi:MAG: hypothetical protein O9345_02295 [Burkholderiaceae bacterium]|nr:hypothetical protein [Burkholderiales bacterium]MCZ8098707.1 hypothetical protein [Burkholderiales bacterium]MCZ8336981.1 hypothetical protein [Burkholderiaceae bacterium]